ncbi:MAG: hypothetical protein NC244_13570 [Alistipes senegalensis]|nr:hypothetical protein [Alistipes senegalensis]
MKYEDFGTEKRCKLCGTVIADMIDGDYFRNISVKYCRDCARITTLENKREKAKQIRELTKTKRERLEAENDLLIEQNNLLRVENDLLRKAVAELRERRY